MPENIHVHLFVTGRVQDVGYRSSTWKTATQLNLKGWVRNLKDGRVEAVFEGPRHKVEEMIHWCHTGPPTALVYSISVQHEPVEGLQEFLIVH